MDWNTLLAAFLIGFGGTSLPMIILDAIVDGWDEFLAVWGGFAAMALIGAGYLIF